MKAYRDLTILLLVFVSNSIHAFQLSPFPTTSSSPATSTRGGFSVGVSSLTFLNSKKPGDDVGHPPTLAIGTFVEFEEKNRVHAGKITKAQEHSKSSASSGGARYQVADRVGKLFDISDKAIRFIIHPPNSPVASEKLFSEFLSAHDASEEVLHKTLDIPPEMFEMVWDESASVEEEDGDHSRMLLTPSAFVDLVHSHDASAIEKYMAWKILRTDMAHVFFKEVKEHGRVVSFKAKTRKAVDAAKQDYCNDHKDSDLCEV
jgi:hypothetical protein